MHLDLWHGRDEVSKGFTTENSPFGWRVLEEVITDEVKGRDGAVVVTYAVVSNPMLASMEVILIKDNRKSGAKIYGTITESMTGWDVKRVLFCKKREKVHQCRPPCFHPPFAISIDCPSYICAAY